MKLLKILTLIICVMLLSSCNDYLEEPPFKSTAVVPKTTKQLEDLLNNYDAFISEPSYEMVYGSDDYGFVPGLYQASNSTYGVNSAIYGTWDMTLAATVASGTFWPVEWKKIFTANLILENLSKVSGTEEEKANLAAEAHFIKAYSYFELATVYCLPYTPQNKDELGLPIKNSTSFEENISRVSLGETYKFIENELTEALKIKRTFSQVNGMNESWRASKAAVNAFAARFYLALYNYQKAETYAQKALDAYNHLRNYNTEMYYSTQPHQVTIFDPDPVQVDLLYPYTVDQQVSVQDRFEFGQSYYFRQLTGGYWPSQSLINLYNHQYDLRYKYHFVENYSYGLAFNPPYSYPGYIFFYRNALPSGPSVPEMILIKAECQARQGKVGPAMNTVNVLRAARMDASAPANVINLSATSQKDAVLKIIAERRREMPFVHRWYDLRRYNNNTVSYDDVTPTRSFYPFNASTIVSSEPVKTYTLDKHSRKFAYPIPNTDILASDGELKQNTY